MDLKVIPQVRMSTSAFGFDQRRWPNVLGVGLTPVHIEMTSALGVQASYRPHRRFITYNLSSQPLFPCIAQLNLFDTPKNDIVAHALLGARLVTGGIR
jgi:hypothetical protein